MKKSSKGSKDDLIVYWSPNYSNRAVDEYDWNMMYADPTNLMGKFREQKNPHVETNDSYMYCPAFKDLFNNVFEFANTSIDTRYAWNTEANAFLPISNSYIDLDFPRTPSLKDTRNIMLALQWNFFCEEPLMMELTPPFFSKAQHMKAGAMIPAKYDIGRWFRPINAEFQVSSSDINEFGLEKDEPMFYTKFLTDRNIVLKRFALTPEIHRLSYSTIRTRNLFGKFRTLEGRYRDFERSRTNKLVLKLIKENVLDD